MAAGDGDPHRALRRTRSSRSAASTSASWPAETAPRPCARRPGSIRTLARLEAFDVLETAPAAEAGTIRQPVGGVGDPHARSPASSTSPRSGRASRKRAGEGAGRARRPAASASRTRSSSSARSPRWWPRRGRSRPSWRRARRRSRACCARWKAREPRPRARARRSCAARSRRTSAPATPPAKPPSPRTRARAGVLLAKQELVVAGLDVALAAFRGARSAVRLGAGGARGRAVLPGHRPRHGDGPRARGPDRRARRAELPAAAVGRRHADAALRGRGRRHRRAHPRHAQDDAAAALPGEARGRGRAAASRTARASTAAILVKDNHVRLAGSVRQATLRAVAGAEGLLGRGGGGEPRPDRGGDRRRRADGPARQLHARGRAGGGGARATAACRSRSRAASAWRTCAPTRRRGPDFIAVGALTHSAPAVDISLEIEPL